MITSYRLTARRPASAHRRVTTVLLAGVLVVGLLATLTGTAHANDPARSRQWALDVIGAAEGHAVGRGAGTTIAIVDSGVDLRHEDLVDNLVAGIDLVARDGSPPQDEFGHGTHVAGIAAAVGDNGRGIRGVAPAARIMPVRVLDGSGRGTSRDVADGVRWAVDNGADVVNLSLGEAGQEVFGSSLTDEIRAAWDRGVIVVVAAGNAFVLSSGFEDEPAVVVSATTRGDRKPDYSNGVGRARWGMAAPGGGCQLVTCPREDDIFSTYWQEGKSDVYAYQLGTSMAAPHVAGAAAVLRSLGLSPQQVVDRLLSSAEDLGPEGRDSTFGAGRLDLAAAVVGLGGGSGGDGGSGDAGGDGDGSSGDPPPTGPAGNDGDTTSGSSTAAPTTPSGGDGPASPTATSPDPGTPTGPPSVEVVPGPSPPAVTASPTPLAGPDGAGDDGGGNALWLVALVLVAVAASALAGVVGRARGWGD